MLGSSKIIKSNVRVVIVTHKSLPEQVSEGLFREDLYYRINLIHIHVPSLYQRREDIPLLIKHFTKNVCQSYEFDEPLISDEVIQWLIIQDYPGNIRQLKNILERTVLLSLDKKELFIKNFQNNMMAVTKKTENLALPNIGEVNLDELEQRMIQ